MNVMLATGGTGGHFYPALQVARELRRRGDIPVVCGSLRIGKDLLSREGIGYFETGGRGFISVNPIKALQFILGMVSAFFKSRKILKEQKSEAVIGFGSYASFPVIAAAKSLGLLTMIHEQNVIPGKANRISAKMVDRIAISFKESSQYFRSKQTVVTGCPVSVNSDTHLSENNDELSALKSDAFTILAFGGSQGSSNLNRTLFEAIKKLIEKEAVQVLHITGESDWLGLKDSSATLACPYLVFQYYDDMSQLYSRADLVIARAGALTVHEIACFEKPAIFIPYSLAGGHQLANARALLDTGRVDIIEENDLNSDILAELIHDKIAHRSDKDSLDSQNKVYWEKAEKNIVDILLSLKKC